MEVASFVFSAAQTLFQALKRSDVKELFSLFGYQSELEKLEKSVSRVKSVLKDAEAKQVLSEQDNDLVEKLRYAVYNADDLLDALITVAEQEEQQHLWKEGGSGGAFTKKVRNLFHRFEKLGVARTMSKEVKKIRTTLDGIARDSNAFNLKVDDRPLKTRREETCSYVYEPGIIGREEDTNRIVEMLLDDSSIKRDVSFITVVGIGGVGKTTLARLVYNHQRVKKDFPLRLWACVADEGQKYLEVQPILSKILDQLDANRKHDCLDIEVLQAKLQEHLGQRKFLLVLDDLWTENLNEWLKLRDYLMGGTKGSQVLITTRSRRTAEIVGNNPPYELQGLTPANSWLLFERTALREDEKQADYYKLVEIGKRIVNKCANVPLAIKVVGSLLYGQGNRKWLSFQENGLLEIPQDENLIISILKFSYHNLPSPLKSCFSYCAIFPKDYILNKELLINLWMAQGYIEPLNGRQSIEDIAEEYFLVLLRRCFFQDIKMDTLGEIVSFKIHDLLHDVAQEVAGKEICVVNSTTNCSWDEKVRHLSIDPRTCTKNVFPKAKIRTYFQNEIGLYSDKQFPVGTLLDNFVCLRVLDLRALHLKSLPGAMDKLLHLRFLDLSKNEVLDMLPKSITRLYNLQTLLLRDCISLKELPSNMNKLVKLRTLAIEGCEELTHIPSLGKLTCLRLLDMFILARANSGSLKRHVGKIGDLAALRNLKYPLKIFIKKDYKYIKEKGTKGGYISNKEDLTNIKIEWEDKRLYDIEYSVEDEEAFLEDLQPPCKLRELELIGYLGLKMPIWAREDHFTSIFLNLVEIKLERCALKQLPRLRLVKRLVLKNLWNLEYIEDVSHSSNTTTYTAGEGTSRSNSRTLEIEVKSSTFFPYLEELNLEDLPKLKEWWRRVGENDRLFRNETCSAKPHPLLSLPHLSKLRIDECPNLTSIPFCRTLESMDLSSSDQTMEFVTEDKEVLEMDSDGEGLVLPEPKLLLSRTQRISFVKIKNMDNLEYLKPLSLHRFGVGNLTISTCNKVESFNDVDEVLCSLSSSIGILIIERCDKLKDLSGLEHLTSLEWLCLGDLPNLTVDQDEKDHDAPWKSFSQNLILLVLSGLGKVVNLPNGIQHLTSLQYLEIDNCPLKDLPDWIGYFSYLRILILYDCKLESLPEAMCELTSLEVLFISKCPAVLEERCREPDGEDWYKIQHVPEVLIVQQTQIPSPFSCIRSEKDPLEILMGPILGLFNGFV